MGRHINLDAVVDELPEVTTERLRNGLSGAADGGVSGHPLTPQAIISPDTHVGSPFDIPLGTPDAAPSPANPDALVERGRVGDGHELE